VAGGEPASESVRNLVAGLVFLVVGGVLLAQHSGVNLPLGVLIGQARPRRRRAGFVVANTGLGLPAVDLVLSNYLGDVNVLRCPSDRQGIFERTRSSYAWNSLLNGQDADHLRVLGLDFAPPQIPVLFDKEAFHRARGDKKGVNYFYADGHLRNLLTIEGVIGK